MSDEEYYSDNNSESEESDDEVVTTKNTNKFRPPTSGVAQINDVDGESDIDAEENDSDEESDIGDMQFGGENEEGGEDEINDDDISEESDNDENDEDEDEDVDVDEHGEIVKNPKSAKKQSKPAQNKKPTQLIIDNDEEDEDDEYDENYLQKFDAEITKNYVNDFHPECFIQNYDEIAKLATVVRNSDNIIIDPNHRTIPFLTKYEKARVLGQRAKQIETGAKPLVKVTENIIDSYVIAELELREKKIPFIIRRPLPNGACEYWYLRDLEVVGF